MATEDDADGVDAKVQLDTLDMSFLESAMTATVVLTGGDSPSSTSTAASKPSSNDSTSLSALPDSTTKMCSLLDTGLPVTGTIS